MHAGLPDALERQIKSRFEAEYYKLRRASVKTETLCEDSREAHYAQ